jgi:hypothetical protein
VFQIILETGDSNLIEEVIMTMSPSSHTTPMEKVVLRALEPENVCVRRTPKNGPVGKL